MSLNNSKEHIFVQYMTPNLLKKKTSSENPIRVYAINLSARNSDYKIEKIENLEQFTELKQLNVSYNRVCKITGLSSLCHLTVLNISQNLITTLDGIQNLSNLMVLKANDNKLTSIPKWLPKRLPKLKTIHLHCNQIDSLHRITYLRSLSNLTVFTFEGNPAADQLLVNTYNSCSSDDGSVVKNAIEKFDSKSIYRIFVIFHLCSLVLLDNKEILPFERQVAEQRYSQVEVSRYLKKLDRYENRLNEVETKKSLLEKDLFDQQSRLDETLRERNVENKLITELEEELRAKDKLLHSKSEELARACLKHFELEQELAFHKIDEKLGLCGLCLPESTNSPYIHQVSPDAMKQVHGNELEYKEVNHGQLTRPNSAPEGSRISSPSVNELHLDKLQEFSISEKSISHEKFPEVSMKETNKSSQTTDKQLCEFSKHSDIKQVQLLLSKLQSELAQLRIRESKILKDDNGNNNNPIYPSKTDNLNKMQLNNHIQMLDDELSKIWTVTSLLKSGSGCGNSVTNVCLNSFATLLKTSSAQSKHASAQSPKCRFHGGLLKHSLPHHQRERSFSLPSEDFDARQIISSNNLIHCNGTTSAGSEFDSCEEFLDISRGLNHSKKKPNRQCRLSHTQRSVTPSTPSSRTTGTGRSTLLSILTPRTNDAYTINDLRKPLPTASEWNLDDHANHNPYNEIHESSSNCIPYESSTPVHVHYVKAKTTNVLNCPRGTGVGGALPTPPFPQPSFESFQSNSLTGNTNEDIIGRDFIQPTKSNNQHTVNSPLRKLDNSGRFHISRLPKPTPSRILSRGSDALQFSDQLYSHQMKGKKMSSKCRSRFDYSLVRSKGVKRKRKLIRSRSDSHKSEKTAADSNNSSSQNYSLSDHAEELLNLIMMSRDACSIEVDRIRADLARMRKANSKHHTHLYQYESSTDQNFYADRVPPMRNHVDSVKTRYSPAGDDNDDYTFTEVQPTAYKTQSRTTYYRQNVEGNHEKNFSPSCTQSKPQTRRLLPYAKSFDENDYSELDANDNQIDNSNGDNDHGEVEDVFNKNQMNYSYYCRDYRQENETVGTVDYCSNPVSGSNWTNDQKFLGLPSSHQRRISQHKNVMAGRRPRTRSIPRHPPVNMNYSSCRDFNHQKRYSRGHSLDYAHSHPKRTFARSSATSLLNDLDYHDNDPSSETAAIIHLTDELLGLRQGLKLTREANSERLEVALRHISLLELELQRQRCLNHDAEVARQREVERSQWEKRLAATLGELRHCQTNIGKLREQVDQLEASKKLSDQSELKLERQQLELDQTKATLDAQKEEINTLNTLLNSLLGLHPNDVSPTDLQRLQVGLLDLHKRMQPDSFNQHQYHHHQQQIPNHFPLHQTLHRTQSLMTGLTASGNEHVNRMDCLNPNVMPTPVVQSSGTNHQLYCNVPEHHDLEDCLGQLQYRIEELCNQQETTQNKLRNSTKIRKKLESQLEEQDSVLGRLKSELLSCQEDLKVAKQEVTRLSYEKEAAQKSKQDQLASMVADITTLETTVSQRRVELSALDTNIQDSDQQLSILKTQAKEAVSKYEEAKREYDTLKSQLDMIRSEKSLADENLEQLRTKLSKTNLQVEQLESNKSSLEKQLTQLEDAVSAKKLEYNQLLPKLSELETKLTRTQHDIQIGAERIRSDHQLRLEDEKLSAVRQAELTRLARQIEEDKLRLEVLGQETEAKKTELELIKAEKRRELENSTSNVRELAKQTANKQQELNDTQVSLNASLDEKERILQSVKALRLERENMLIELNREQKSVAELNALVTRQNREYEHLTEMSRLEESRILNLSLQQRDLINQLERLQTQLNEEKEELREHEVAKIRKNTEYETIRKDVLREQSELEYIRKEKEQVELELTHLRQERDITKSQWDNFQSKTKELETQNTVLKDSISESNLLLARIKAESEAVSNELRQKNIERNAVLADCDRIFKQTTDSRGEFNIVQQRLQKASELKQSIESSLNEQRRQRMLLSDELSHLEEAVHTGRLAKQLADESKEASEDALKNAMNKLDKLQSERKILEEELSSLRISKDNELCYLDERLRTTRQHLESVELELSQKSSKLNEVNEKLNIVQNELISKEQAKSKYEELERELEKLKQHQKYSMGDDENKQTSLSHLFNELETKSSTKTQDNNNNNSSNNNLLQVLMDTKSALIAAQRESKRLKRRTAREVAELERVAEEQCNRAGDLTEQLSLARRHYAQLRSQITTYGILMDEVITIASQTELTEHGKRLEAVLSAVRAELEQHNMVNTLADENDRSGSIIFGQKIHEMLNPEPDSRISQDHLSSDARIQDMAGLNYSSSGLEKSLLLLKNSFHELSHSPSNLYSFQSLTGSLNGLYKKANPFSSGVCPNNHTGHMDEPGTNYTTSGLGSSLNPGTQAESNGSAQENSAILSPSTLVGTKPIGNDWKQKVSSSVGRQLSHVEVESPITSASVHQSYTPRHSKSGRTRSRPT